MTERLAVHVLIPGDGGMRNQRFEVNLTTPPAIVSEFLAHLENDPLWRSEITDSVLVEGENGRVGALYHETVNWEGIHATVPLRVEEYVVAERLRLVSQEPGYDGISDYRFTATDTGTSVELVQSVETSGAFKLIEPFMWGVVARWLGHDLNGIDDAIARRDQLARNGPFAD